MIESFEINNYKSIVSAKLDFSFNRRAPKGYKDNDLLFFIEKGKKRAVPILVCYGSNSSGKSTFIGGIKIFLSLIKGSEPTSFYYKPNKLDNTLLPTSFFITAYGKKEYQYYIRYKDRVEEEWLKEDGVTIFNNENSSLPVLRATKGEARKTLIDSIVSVDSFSINMEEAFRFYVENSLSKNEEECRERVVALIKKMDLSISDAFSFSNVWRTMHINKDEENRYFELDEESEGTKRLFGLVSYILSSLESGLFLVLDEIDISLHSIVLSVLVSLFSDKRYNKNGAQLLCTCHNTDLLDAPFLTQDEIAIVDKTRKKGTMIKRLSEIEIEGKNFRKEYLAGLYSGIPFPYI